MCGSIDPFCQSTDNNETNFSKIFRNFGSNLYTPRSRFTCTYNSNGISLTQYRNIPLYVENCRWVWNLLKKVRISLTCYWDRNYLFVYVTLHGLLGWFPNC